jgi:hypothetical protein
MKKLINKVDSLKLTFNKKNPPDLIITCVGSNLTTGWTEGELIRKSENEKFGIFQFEFTANPPIGGSGDGISDIEADYILSPVPQNLHKIIIYSETNLISREYPKKNNKFIPISDDLIDEATGYSDSYSFEEAFKDAIANLPPYNPPISDYLENIRVTLIGAEVGGIADFNRLYVKVERTKFII